MAAAAAIPRALDSTRTAPRQHMHDVATSLALAATVGLAVRSDLVAHRIPNSLTLAALAVALALQTAFGGVDGALRALAGAAVGLTCLLPFYLGRGMGGGDVKLMAATGAFLGPATALLAVGLSLVAGAVLAVVFVVWRLVRSRAAMQGAPSGLGPATAWTFTMVPAMRAERSPYAVAIGLGAIAALWLRGGLDAHFTPVVAG